jgi:hypothetical protein
MSAGERSVARGVPVLRENNMLKLRRDPMDDINDSVPIGNGQRAAGAEVVLYVDD